MSYYKLRVDTSDEERVRSMVQKHFGKYLYCREEVGTPNAHYHFYLELLCKPATLRAYIRRHFGSGNGSYSLKELDEPEPIEYLAYIVKQGDIMTNLDTNVLDNARAYDAKVKAEIREKKAARRTQLEILIDRFTSDPSITQASDESWYHTRPPMSKNPLDLGHKARVDEAFIAEFVVDHFKQEGTLIRKFQLVSLSQTLCLKFVTGYGRQLQDIIVRELTSR